MAEIAESCRAFAEDLSALVDGELGAVRRAEVEAHFAGCAACASRLEELRAVDRLLAALPAPAPAPDLAARLAARIEDERSARNPAPLRKTRRFAPALALPVAAAAALALYLALRAPGPTGGPAAPVPVAKAPAAPPQVAPPAEPAPPQFAERAEPAPVEGELESLDAEALAVVLELETIEDLPVIANLEALERLLREEAG